MKNIIKKSILTLAMAASLALPGAVQAQPKIATIDLRKVFDNYYKTKQADALLKDEASDLEKQRKGMYDDYKKRQEEFNTLNDKANDQAISADERTKNKQAAEKKYVEVRDTEQSITEFERAARTKLAEKQRIKRDVIVTEIRGIVDAKAKTAGYSLVVDTAGESINNTPFVLYSNGENDITEAILGQLNAAAPAVTGKTDDGPASKTNAAPTDKTK